MTKADWIWMPHAGHSIVKDSCQFHLCTYVNGYIVSTIGEYWPDRDIRRIIHREDQKLISLKGDEFDAYYRRCYGFEEIGDERRYETMVFIAEKRKQDDYQCCPYHIGEYVSDAFDGYDTAEKATKGHMRFCFEFDEKTFPSPKLEGFQDVYEKSSTGNDLINMTDLSKAIKQFNHNVESIKTWMSAQNTHNSLFIDRIGELEKQMKNKAEYQSPFRERPQF